MYVPNRDSNPQKLFKKEKIYQLRLRLNSPIDRNLTPNFFNCSGTVPVSQNAAAVTVQRKHTRFLRMHK